MRNKIIVEKLIAYTGKIQNYCTGLDYENFENDTKPVDACVFNLSQMGELANRIDPAFAEKHSDIPWRYLYGLRNRIVHDYEGVNLQLIWEIISDDLEPLKQSLMRIVD